MNKIFVNKMDLLRYDIEISYKNKLERQRKCERLIKRFQYYNKNANLFVETTANVEFYHMQNRFLSKLETGAHILDFGCGSGRDTKFFLEQGYRVDAIDGSAELCNWQASLLVLK